ncbi:YSIRK-type signal peptide-containing protein [Streptococcus sp. ZJ151]|uniref:GA-like domain-containing protein n=1 Tax=Streptococcus jiangjianxini TaxID=3161189 RepID=UPI0032ED7AF0
MFLNQKQRFSIRKYSFGAASVLLGTVLLGLAVPEVSADSVQEGTIEQFSSTDNVAQSNAGSTGMEAVAEEPVSETDAMSTVSASSETSNAEVSENQNQEITALAPTEVDEEATSPLSNPSALQSESPDLDDEQAVGEALAAVVAAEEALGNVSSRVASLRDMGVINPRDKNEIDQLNSAVEDFKKKALPLVEKLPQDERKNGLQMRLDKVNPIEVEINDKNYNYRPDDIEEALEEAEKAVEEAEAAEKMGDAEQIKEKKGLATSLVKKVEASVNDKIELYPEIKNLNERLDVIKTPEVSDADKEMSDQSELSDESKTDKEEIDWEVENNAFQAAKDAIRTAEEALKAVETKIAESKATDGTISLADKKEVERLNNELAEKKRTARDLIQELKNDSFKNSLMEALQGINLIEMPEVSDAEKEQNDEPMGDDSVTKVFPETDKEEANKVAEVEKAVAEAEAAAKEAEDKKAKLSEGKVIKESDKREIDRLNTETTTKKALAKLKVDDVKDPEKKKALEERLEKLKIESVEVNDENENGIPDDEDRKKEEQEAEAAVVEAEKAVEKLKTKLQEYEAISESDKKELEKLNKEILAKKEAAKSLLTKLTEDENKQELLARFEAVNEILIEVNDKNNNNIPDVKDEAKAEDSVQIAETSYKKLQVLKKTVESDTAINPQEKKDIVELNDATQAKKNTAEALVKALADGQKKNALIARLGAIKEIDVTVNDTNNSGRPDDVDKAFEAFQEAQALMKKAEEKKRAAESDQIIDEDEKAEIDKLNEEIKAKKAESLELTEKLSYGAAKKFLKEMTENVKTVDVELTKKEGQTEGNSKPESKEEPNDKPQDEPKEDGKPEGDQQPDNNDQLKEEGKSESVPQPDAKEEQKDQPQQPGIQDEQKDQPQQPGTQDEQKDQPQPESNQPNTDDTAAKEMEAAIKAAEAAVKAAEEAAKQGEDKKMEVELDKLVNPAEKAALDALNKVTTDKKTAATDLVDKLPDGDSKTALKDRLGKVTPSQVTVNDANSNGKADSLDSIIARADFFTTSTERSAQAAKAKKAEVEKDGLVTPAEKQAVDSLNAEITKSKQSAEKFVDTLPEGKEKDEFKARLGKVTPSEVVVNDADSNGKADSQDRLDVAEAAVKAAEAAVKAAEEAAKQGEDKKMEVELDKLVNPAEKAALDALNKVTTDKKTAATDLVDKVVDETKKADLKSRLNKVKTSEVVVNDENSNGKADSQDRKEADDLAAAEVAVAAAESVAKVGQAEQSKVLADKAVSQGEKAALDKLNADTKGKKDKAMLMVEDLPTSAKKTELEKRLAAVQEAKVEVNDYNNNGKPDDEDKAAEEAAAENAVQAAEIAARLAEATKLNALKDNKVTQQEKDEVDQLNADTMVKKEAATPLVETLSEGDTKAALVKRLDAVKPVTVEVTKEDNNDVQEKTEQSKTPEKHPETPKVPAVPETPEVPEQPKTPEAPETPETPKAPETPEQPKVPEVSEAPEAPELPKVPEVPELPNTPEAPKAPEQPKVPEVSEAPERPEIPEAPEEPKTPETPELPKAPEAPELPNTPEAPKAPEQPKVPEVSEAPERPEIPEAPEEPKTPETPKVPAVPETPKVPEAPELPKVQEVPELPDTPEAPKAPEEPKTPDTPKVPEAPELPETPDQPKVPETDKSKVAPKTDATPDVKKPELDPKVDDSEKGNSAKTGRKVVPMVTKPAGRTMSPQSVKTSALSQTKSDESLPRTGERNNPLATMYGGMTIALAALFASKKRKRDRGE